MFHQTFSSKNISTILKKRQKLHRLIHSTSQFQAHATPSPFFAISPAHVITLPKLPLHSLQIARTKKSSRCERNLPKNHTFRSHLAHFCTKSIKFHLLYNKTSAECDCFHSAEVLLFLCEMITQRGDGRFPLCHHHRLH